MQGIIAVKQRNILPLFLFVIALLVVQGCSGGGSGSDHNYDETEAKAADSLNDKRVRWGFGEQALTGTFANGDPWVVGPVTIVSISPSFTGNRHGWEVNPSSTFEQGFDSRVNDFRRGLVPSLPYTASPGESLVKTVSNTGNCSNPCRFLLGVSVLTVLAAPPPNNGATVFRPSYFGTNKTLHSTNDLQFNLLPNLAPTPNATSFTEVARDYSNVQLDHKENFTGGEMHPLDSMPAYGSDIATRNAEAALALMMQASNTEKRQAVINYVNYGLDVYYQNIAGVEWNGGGGHGEGRKLPAAMAAVLLNDAALLTDLANAEREDFGETFGATFSVRAGTSLWGQFDGEFEYWDQITTGFGSRSQRDPYQQIDGGNLRDGVNGNYQFCCTTKPWEAIVAAVRLMPALGTAMNVGDLDIYVQRWRSQGFHTQPDTCAPSTGNMGDYGILFGPDGFGGCIPDTDPTDGIGRFPQMHGLYAAEGFYGSRFADEIWDAYL